MRMKLINYIGKNGRIMQQNAFYRKLGDIRGKINLYMAQKISANVVEKCARSDEIENFDECEMLSAKEMPPEEDILAAEPRQTEPDESVSIKIPEFLCKDKRSAKLDKFLENKDESFSEMLLRLIDEKGLKDSEVYKQANIDRRLFSKIRGDEEYVPSKKTVISFCLALQLGIDESNRLLATAGYTLSSSSRFDLIIMYLLENKEYNIQFANIVLDDYGEGTLSR